MQSGGAAKLTVVAQNALGLVEPRELELAPAAPEPVVEKQVGAPVGVVLRLALHRRDIVEHALDTADRIMRVAFGTFLGLPEPEQFLGDASYVRPRARLLEDGAWIAERDGELVGSTFATRWGTFGFFGPLSVRPELWDTGIGRRLMDPVQEAFERWGIRHAGLFTWPHSPKHLALYQRYGFWPHALTTVMALPLNPEDSPSAAPDLLSEHPEHGLEITRDVSAAVHDGLDLSEEAAATVTHRLGDVVLTTAASPSASTAPERRAVAAPST